MIDDFFEKPHRRGIRELNLVPIIDMFTTVVFFLLLSTSFLYYTKLTIPPSKVSVITDPVAPPPLAPKILLTGQNGKYRMTLHWAGKEPGESSEWISGSNLESSSSEVVSTAKRIVQSFHDKYPAERSLQMGMSSEVPYQLLISTMDGARDLMPDIALISYDEALAFSQGLAGKDPAP